ncbi:MAG: replication-associated recombination protein A [archaeon]|nr:replication-associated recombination protein A [archaeon]
MDLFDDAGRKNLQKDAPLADRMRPTTLSEVVGQEHILGEGKLLSRAIRSDKIGSLIFYGPPGTGKTTLARVIANTTKSFFKELSATCAGKKDIENAIKLAQNNLGMHNRKTIVFIDEIHRFNKSQQDSLLPFVENGTITLIGATTENPYFEVNKSLISRSIIFELNPLSPENISFLIKRAVVDDKKGLGGKNIVIDNDAVEFIAGACNGDARVALNALEIGFFTTDRDKNGIIHITKEVASSCIQKRILNYDKSGDSHYDTISAFIKSMRGSDPDAAIYYLARMLYAGEDINFIARRIMICASEDVSNADPQAIVIATCAAQAVERIGMPESQIILAQATAYVACAPKSNSAVDAIYKATNAVREKPHGAIPSHLRDSQYQGAEKLGRGVSYKYPHNFENHYVKQQYLPDDLNGVKFYVPSDNGYERTIKRWLEKIWGE